jgi:Uma2 family endonuclease
MTTLAPQPAQKQSSRATPKRIGSRIVALKTSDARIRKGKVELVPKPPKYDGLRMDKADFLAWERDSDGWKYEWNNGRIENNEVNMTIKEIYIVRSLNNTLRTTKYIHEGDLYPEVDCALTPQTIRRPDIAYFTNEQVNLGKTGAMPVPSFVIEIASKHDKDEKRITKVEEYFASGVQCVWYVYPELRRVDVYSSPKHITVCTDDDVCSAAPALPEFMPLASTLFE